MVSASIDVAQNFGDKFELVQKFKLGDWFAKFYEIAYEEYTDGVNKTVNLTRYPQLQERYDSLVETALEIAYGLLVQEGHVDASMGTILSTSSTSFLSHMQILYYTSHQEDSQSESWPDHVYTGFATVHNAKFLDLTNPEDGKVKKSFTAALEAFGEWMETNLEDGKSLVLMLAVGQDQSTRETKQAGVFQKLAEGARLYARVRLAALAYLIQPLGRRQPDEADLWNGAYIKGLLAPLGTTTSV